MPKQLGQVFLSVCGSTLNKIHGQKNEMREMHICIKDLFKQFNAARSYNGEAVAEAGKAGQRYLLKDFEYYDKGF